MRVREADRPGELSPWFLPGPLVFRSPIGEAAGEARGLLNAEPVGDAFPLNFLAMAFDRLSTSGFTLSGLADDEAPEFLEDTTGEDAEASLLARTAVLVEDVVSLSLVVGDSFLASVCVNRGEALLVVDESATNLAVRDLPVAVLLVTVLACLGVDSVPLCALDESIILFIAEGTGLRR